MISKTMHKRTKSKYLPKYYTNSFNVTGLDSYCRVKYLGVSQDCEPRSSNKATDHIEKNSHLCENSKLRLQIYVLNISSYIYQDSPPHAFFSFLFKIPPHSGLHNSLCNTMEIQIIFLPSQSLIGFILLPYSVP